MALLTSMQAREAAGHQPYELLAARKRRNRRERRNAVAALEDEEEPVGGRRVGRWCRCTVSGQQALSSGGRHGCSDVAGIAPPRHAWLLILRYG